MDGRCRESTACEDILTSAERRPPGAARAPGAAGRTTKTVRPPAPARRGTVRNARLRRLAREALFTHRRAPNAPEAGERGVSVTAPGLLRRTPGPAPRQR